MERSGEPRPVEDSLRREGRGLSFIVTATKPTTPGNYSATITVSTYQPLLTLTFTTSFTVT
jgi:hypothetical protein